MLRRTMVLVACTMVLLGVLCSVTLSSAQDAGSSIVGAVFVMTNAATNPISGRGNEVVMYLRQSDGRLILHAYFPTGGGGSGPGFVQGLQADPLGSQGALILSKRHFPRLLFAVNAGSDEVSAFRVYTLALRRVAKVPSGGAFPVSVTSHGDLLYVLNADLVNAGANANITGFSVDEFGGLSPLAGSTRPVVTTGSIQGIPDVLRAPAQVQFSPDGSLLIVTIKQLGGPGLIHVFSVDSDGLPSQEPVFTLESVASPGNSKMPFGFTFDARGRLLVTEVFGAPENVPPDPPLPFFNASAVSSYRLNDDGTLEVISDSIGNGQTAACWVASVGPFAYVTNTASNTLTGYRVSSDGHLTLLDFNGISARTNGHPLDVGVSRNQDGRFLYVLLPETGKVGVWAIETDDGSLTFLEEVGGLEPTPATAPDAPFSLEGGSAAGLAVR